MQRRLDAGVCPNVADRVRHEDGFLVVVVMVVVGAGLVCPNVADRVCEGSGWVTHKSIGWYGWVVVVSAAGLPGWLACSRRVPQRGGQGA